MKLFITIFIFFPIIICAQLSDDTIIDLGIYRSYYNRTIKQPIAVTYTLFHGGGNASRNNDGFTLDPSISTCTDKDYLHSGYDRGHMVPAEDFAYSDSLQAITFRYYNCVPQYPRMNRGLWKHYEAEARTLSQSDTITVVCYNYYTSATKSLCIPSVCYKAVYKRSLSQPMLLIGVTNEPEPKHVLVPDSIVIKMQQYRDLSSITQ